MNPPALDALFERYHQHQQLLNYSPRTWESQGAYLRLLGRFLAAKAIADVQAVTALTLQEFQHWLFYQPTPRGGARSAVNQNQVLIAVKMFFRFLHAENCLARDPSKELRYLRAPRSLPRGVLTPQEAARVLRMPDTHTALGYRDRTLLEVLYATGIRRNELLNLRLADVDLDGGLLRINQGKGGHDRVVPLTRLAGSFLENYLKAVRPQLLAGRADAHIFLSMKRCALGTGGVQHIVARYGREAGLKKRLTCHVWRHSCATHLLKNNTNLRHVQELLGHRSLSTTERYLHLTITDLKAAHRKYHPRERAAPESGLAATRAGGQTQGRCAPPSR